MRICELRVDGFGKFTAFECGPIEKPVTIFHGSNEAGKSTLLAFIRRILYGFPDGRSVSNPYPPLAGGRHGGSLTIVRDSGEMITIDRSQGPRGGSVRLTSASGEPVPPADLPTLLGNHSRTVFENIFAFTLDELNDEKHLKDDSINSQLYSAGMGAASVPESLKALKAEKGQLFRKGGRKHVLHGIADALDRVDGELEAVRGNAAQFGKLSARLVEIEQELGELGERRLKNTSELERHRDLQSAWHDWNDLLDAEKQLRALPQIGEFPPDGVSQLEKLQDRIASAEEEYRKASLRVKDVKDLTVKPIENESILGVSALVRSLERSRGAFDQLVRDLPKREAGLAAKRVDLDRTLSELGPEWNMDRLVRFDLSMVVREEVAAHERCLNEAKGELDRVRSAVTRDLRAVDEATQEVARSRAELNGQLPPDLDADAIHERRRRIRRARRSLEDFARLEGRVEDLRSQLDEVAAVPSLAGAPYGGRRVVAATAGIIGLIGLVASSFFWGNWVPLLIGVAASLPLLAAAAVLLLRWVPGAQPALENVVVARIRRQLRQLEQQSDRFRSQLAAEADGLGVESLDATTLDANDDELDDESERLAEWRRLNDTLAEAETQLRNRELNHEETVRRLKDTQSSLASTEDAWRQWLATRGLRQSFSPGNIEVLERLGACAVGRFSSGRMIRGRGNFVLTTAVPDIGTGNRHRALQGGVNRSPAGSMAVPGRRHRTAIPVIRPPEALASA